jgi:hypothetical protein
MNDFIDDGKPLRSERLAARGHVYSSAHARLHSPGLKWLVLLQGLAILVFA